MSSEHNQTERIYRLDRFTVPSAGRDEFLDRVRTTHEFLRMLPGFVQDIVMERATGRGESNVVTLVEWSGEESVENARAAVAALHEEMDFSPRELFERVGIKAEREEYRRIDAVNLALTEVRT